jgi:hypothetical protein
MNYATIEEAWAKPKGTSLNKIPISSVKHPLVAKREMATVEEPMAAPPIIHDDDDDDDDMDIKAMTGLRRALRRLYDRRGCFGIDLVLPSGYVQEHAARNKANAAPMSLDSLVDIEEIAKWMLMAAIVYIIFDLAK